MKILYGTTNIAKLNTMQRAVKPLGIELIGLNDLKCEIPIVDECGETPLENAQIKAKAYYDTFRTPVFSCDSGLYFDEVEEHEQPGIYIRRVNGKMLSDEEMIQYYSSLVRQYGGKLTGRYRNAICLILDKINILSSMDISLATEPFLLVSEPHQKRVKGFPLDSLSKDIMSGEYYYDLEMKNVDSTAMEEGFRKFFIQTMIKSKR